ncbi:acyltransferase [Morganella morganii subsp. morganii]|uniref:acyltransferase family protein n=1 Tax=Morganella morganii TaxID=582 RepID=UPI000F5A8B28|nr:acyltransferase [Morganella morganii]MBT0447464.1 acyltransferase [Morganella morganii subsp. morganii]
MYSIIAMLAIFLSFFVISFACQKANLLPHITPESSEKRYLFIDGLRGIAAVSVVVGHIWRVGVKGVDLNGYYISEWADYVAAFGVQVFFCITGFLFFDQVIRRKATFDWEKFYIARIKRLAPLFFLTMTVCIFLIILSKFRELSAFTFGDMYSAMSLYLFGFGGQVKILGQYSGLLTAVTWTLPFEWRFYLLLPIACVAIKTNKIKYLIAFVVSMAALSFIIDAMNIWPYFLIGATSAYAFNKIKINNKTAINIVSLIGVSFLLTSPFLIKSKYDLSSFVIMFFFFISIVLSKPKLLTTNTFVYIGEASYSIYLIHSIACIVISYIIYHIFGVIKSNEILSIFIYSLSSMAICAISIFSFKTIEYPFIKK